MPGNRPSSGRAYETRKLKWSMKDSFGPKFLDVIVAEEPLTFQATVVFSCAAAAFVNRVRFGTTVAAAVL